jgi:hypothetical protein
MKGNRRWAPAKYEERLRRFEQEARILSALNHAICW